MDTIAEVVLCCGRLHLRVAGFYLATEGDKCCDGSLPEDVLPPIPEEELATATIGGQPVKDMPISVVRSFRGDCWNESMMNYVAAEINRRIASPAPPPPDTPTHGLAPGSAPTPPAISPTLGIQGI